MTGYMLDTNIFNRVLDGQVRIDVLQGRILFATHIQLKELRRTKCETRRMQLVALFRHLKPRKIRTSTWFYGEDAIGEGLWASGDGVYERMLKRLEELDREAGKRPKGARRLNQSRDVRIAETAIKHGLTVVTTDPQLLKLIPEFGGRAITLDQFQRL